MSRDAVGNTMRLFPRRASDIVGPCFMTMTSFVNVDTGGAVSHHPFTNAE
jgi:hypothetical protein